MIYLGFIPGNEAAAAPEEEEEEAIPAPLQGWQAEPAQGQKITTIPFKDLWLNSWNPSKVCP